MRLTSFDNYFNKKLFTIINNNERERLGASHLAILDSIVTHKCYLKLTFSTFVHGRAILLK